MPGAFFRSPIVSNSGTAITLEVGGDPDRHIPASLSRMLTSSRSEILSALEMTYVVIAPSPNCAFSSAAAATIASSEQVSSP
jgi:hypothetical protein